MNESKQNIPSNFESKEEAFEYLIQQSQNQALKEEWKNELDQMPGVPIEHKKAVRNIFTKKVIAIAASFILVLGSFYWLTSRENSLQQMAETMLDDTRFILNSGSITRGTNEDEIDDFSMALQKEIDGALENEDYEAALGLFLTKEKRGQLSKNDKFYYSLSLARTTNADYYKAIRLLDDVTQEKDKYYNEALWLQALLYLKINEPNKSKIILNKLINNSNYQIKNIRALLERMTG